jgi:hypothetical protein
MQFPVQKIIKNRKKNGSCQILKVEQGLGNHLVGAEFHFSKMKRIIGMADGNGHTTLLLYLMLPHYPLKNVEDVYTLV